MPQESNTIPTDTDVRAHKRREHLSRIGEEISELEMRSSRIDRTVDETQTKTEFGGIPKMHTPVQPGQPWLIRGAAVVLGFGVLGSLIGLQVLDRSVSNTPEVVENAPAPATLIPEPVAQILESAKPVQRQSALQPTRVAKPVTMAPILGRTPDPAPEPTPDSSTDPGPELESDSRQLTGIVFDTEGVGIANASVESPADGSSVVTDQDGKFRLPLSAETGDPQTFVASANEYESQRIKVDFRKHDGPVSIAFQLPSSVRLSGITGMVQAGDGGDIEGARVSLSTLGQGGEKTTTVDIAGQFNFDNIDEGRYLLTVTAPPPYRTYVAPEFALDSSGHYLDITLDTLATATVSGVMVDEKGEPAAHLAFYAVSDGDAHRRFEAVTDADGQFRIDGIPVGALLLRSTTTESDVLQTIDVPAEGVEGVKVVVQSELLRPSVVSR